MRWLCFTHFPRLIQHILPEIHTARCRFRSGLLRRTRQCRLVCQISCVRVYPRAVQRGIAVGEHLVKYQLQPLNKNVVWQLIFKVTGVKCVGYLCKAALEPVPSPAAFVHKLRQNRRCHALLAAPFALSVHKAFTRHALVCVLQKRLCRHAHIASGNAIVVLEGLHVLFRHALPRAVIYVRLRGPRRLVKLTHQPLTGDGFRAFSRSFCGLRYAFHGF